MVANKHIKLYNTHHDTGQKGFDGYRNIVCYIVHIVHILLIFNIATSCIYARIAGKYIDDYLMIKKGSIYALQSGIVKYAGYLKNYGETVVVCGKKNTYLIYSSSLQYYIKKNDKIIKGDKIAYTSSKAILRFIDLPTPFCKGNA